MRNTRIGRLASPGRRLGGYLLDVLFLFIAFLPLFAGLLVDAITVPGSGGGGALGVLLGEALLLVYAVWAIILFTKGTTPGKRLLGMRVIMEDGSTARFLTMLVREWIGKWISAMVLSLGFVWILIDRDRQGWHDKLMSTYVVR